jgi:hypothetical protein
MLRTAPPLRRVLFAIGRILWVFWGLKAAFYLILVPSNKIESNPAFKSFFQGFKPYL